MSPRPIVPPARLADSLDRPAAKWNSHLDYQPVPDTPKTAPAHGHWGSNGAWAGLYPRALRGQCGSDRARGVSGSAALGRREMLDRQLRRAVRLQHAHLLVVAMMADMLDVMAAHL